MEDKFLDAIDHYRDYYDSNSEKLADHILICECNCVSALDIRLSKGTSKEVDFEFLKNQFGFGSACGSCIKNKENWLERL